jgi:hypothetical protein
MFTGDAHGALPVWLIASVGAITCLPGCAGPRELRPSDRATYGDELREAQVYLATETFLSRLVQDTDANVASDHVLVTSRDATVEEVKVSAKTPGVIVGFDDVALLVSFEPPVDGRERILRFVPDGVWYVLVSEPGVLPQGTPLRDEDVILNVLPVGGPSVLPVLQVQYDDRAFLLGRFNVVADPWPLDTNPHISSFSPSPVPHLLVNSQHLDALEKRRRNLPGRVLPSPTP